MALPMDEQRMLDEIERLLAADDPRFAARLTSFGRSGFRGTLRTGRARAMVSAIAVALVAAAAIAFYAMNSIGIGKSQGQTTQRTPTTHSSSVVVHAQLPVTGPNNRP